MTAVIEQALREAFARSESSRGPRSTVLPTVAGSGLQPGVDLDDSSALLELMETERS